MSEMKGSYSGSEQREFGFLIEERIKKAEEQLTILKGSNGYGGDYEVSRAPGIFDNAANDSSREMNIGLMAKQTKLINDLKIALGSVRNGTYGICLKCGELIPKERLLAVLQTSHCVKHALDQRQSFVNPKGKGKSIVIIDTAEEQMSFVS